MCLREFQDRQLVGSGAQTIQLFSGSGLDRTSCLAVCLEWVIALEFYTIGKSDRSVRSDRDKMQFLKIITI